MSRYYLFFMIALSIFAVTSFASQLLITFTGQVESVLDPDYLGWPDWLDNPYGSAEVGDIFKYGYVVNMDATSDPGAIFNFQNPIDQWSFSIGDSITESGNSTDGLENFIEVMDGYSTDIYAVRQYITEPDVYYPGTAKRVFEYTRLELYLVDSTGTVFDSRDMPAALDLTDFNETYFQIRDINSNLFVTGTITDLQCRAYPVPVPSALVLTGIGMTSASCFKRKNWI